MKKRILADHKKVGKKMIPPIYQHPDMNIQESDYATDTLPEIIWMGLIHKEFFNRFFNKNIYANNTYNATVSRVNIKAGTGY